MLFLISSKNKLKANHNHFQSLQRQGIVVFNILKEQIESKSQRGSARGLGCRRCF